MADDSAADGPTTRADGSREAASVAGDDASAPPAPLQPVASTLGTVAAGLMLAALFVPGEGVDTTVAALPLGSVARGAAVLALAVFVLHRRVGLPDRPAGVVAAITGLVAAVVDLLTLFGEVSLWSQPLGLPLATACAIPVIGMGVAMALAVPPGRVFAITRGIGVAALSGILGFLVSAILSTVLTGTVMSIIGRSAISIEYPVLTISTAVSIVLVVAYILSLLGKDRAWLDLAVPTRRDLVVAAAGLIGLLVVLQGVSILISEFGLPAIESTVEEEAKNSGTPEFLLVLVPLSFLAIAPSEELLYRGVVQKYLYDYISERQAIVVASIFFALTHGGQYADPDPIRMAVSLSTVFILSLGLGYIYARTENLIVPILVHGAFNAISFLAMYARVTGGAGMA